MRWRSLGTITLTSSWQFILVPAEVFIRVIHRNIPSNPTAWICQAERLTDGTYQIFNQQSLKPQGGILTEVFKLETTEIFSNNYVGLRQKFSSTLGWEAEIQEADIKAGNDIETIFTSEFPAVLHQGDSAYSLGLKFQSVVDGYLQGIRFWKDENEAGIHFGKIWEMDGTLLKSVEFTRETRFGWQEELFTERLLIKASTIYLVSVNSNFSYVITTEAFASPRSNKSLIAIGNKENGVYGLPDEMPTNIFNHSNYFRDVIFVPA